MAAPIGGGLINADSADRRDADLTFTANSSRFGRFPSAVKNSGSTTLRDAVENIIDTLKEDGSMKTMFAVYGVKYLDASAALAGK
jgi:hypothetical protein